MAADDTNDQSSRDSSSVWDTPLGLFAKSQEQAVKVAGDTLNKVRAMATSGVTSPDVLLTQVAELSGAVTGLASSATGLTGAVAQPLQDFLVQQRQLAEAVAKFAEVQAELAVIVSEFAQRQAAAVAAIERVANPVFDVMGGRPDE
ncbi:MAG: hypothetical protein QM658_00205 [Gordonia sp. (in: high G+C Gram-positive bacteria)]